MPLTLGSNISSLSAQRRLSENTKDLSKTYERLSSGLRINSASDDSAGLSISDSLKTSTRVFNQGVRNLNDGISLLNIADSAIESLSNITVRLKELAGQAANGTYSATQRKALDKEAQALSKEYTRIIQNTKFNGVSLLNGGLGSGVRLQAGFGTDGSILAGVGGATGTGTFNGAVTYASGSGGYYITTGDLNGDGNIDLAVSSGNTIQIMTGNGDGSFQQAASYDTGSLVFNNTLDDFNNDGILDAVAINSTSVNVWLGNGDGTFQSSTTYVTGTGGRGVDTGDFNSDGYVDLVVANGGATSVSIYLNSGDGTFGSAISITGLTSPLYVNVKDFDSDGNLDIAVAENSASISILLGNGNGTFDPRISYGSAGATYLDSADLNNDGVTDIVTADSGFFEIFLGNSDGTFTSAVSYSTGTARTIDFGDLNGDGFLDLVTGNQASSVVNIYLNNGNGTFGAATSFSAGIALYSAIVNDFNNDGVDDIVTSTITGTVSVLSAITREGSSILREFSLESVSSAKQALSVFNGKISSLSIQRGQLGSYLSRIGVGLSVLQSTSENYAIAEGRIRDANIAEESSKLVRRQILQQASAAILAQANLQPALSLNLLSVDG